MSQPSASQGPSQSDGRGLRHLDDFNEQDADTIVGDVMRMLLFSHTKRHPCKIADLRKVVKSRCDIADVMKEAKKRFRRIFGYELAEAPQDVAKAKQLAASANQPKSSGKKRKKEATSGLFVLINAKSYSREEKGDDEAPGLDLVKEFNRQGTEEEVAIQGFLSVVLALIQLENGALREERLLAHLHKLGLGERSFLCGSVPVKELLNNVFTKQRYLERQRAVQDQENVYVFKCGPRSRLEMAAAPLFEFVSTQIMQKSVDRAALDHFIKQGGEANNPL